MLLAADLASYQAHLDAAEIPVEAIIVKATEGLSYLNPFCDQHYQQAKTANKPRAVYHFAGSSTDQILHDPVAEAEFFLTHTRGYHQDAILILDFEPYGYLPDDAPAWVQAWGQTVTAATGTRPVIYMDQNILHRYDWAPVAEQFDLWLAGGQRYDQYHTPGQWPDPAELPNTPTGWNLFGIQYTAIPYDLDVIYRTPDQWAAQASGHPTDSPTPEPAPPVSIDGASSQPTPTTTYTVQPGDTLSEIAERYHTSWPTLAQVNNLANPDLIYPGQQLIIHTPTTITYTVVEGDTLSEIAERYHTSVDHLAATNHIDNPDLIYPGQTLTI